MTRITDRIERELGLDGLTALLASRIPASDLQSLLLEVFRLRSRIRSPAAVLSDYGRNRFVRPAALSPVSALEWDRLAWSLLPDEFEPIELSPVAPLGTCSSGGRVSQDWSVTTVRNTEVVSDPTNVLALEAALRRRDQRGKGARVAAPVHLASSHRVLRAQHFNTPGAASHFRVFALCSAHRDLGAWEFEREALLLQIGFYLRAAGEFLGSSARFRLSLTLLEPDGTLGQMAERLFGELRSEFEGLACVPDPSRESGRGYYTGSCFKLAWLSEAGPVELVDGGGVDWTRRLLSDEKERMVISGIGTDRLCAIRGDRRGRS